MKKKLLSLAICLAMLLTLLPVTALADSGQIIFYGVPLEDGVPVEAGNGTVTFEEDTMTVTLNNASRESTGIDSDDPEWILYSTFPTPLTIRLEGSNDLRICNLPGFRYGLATGIKTDGSLVLEGPGSLKLDVRGTDYLVGIRSKGLQVLDVPQLEIVCLSSAPDQPLQACIGIEQGDSKDYTQEVYPYDQKNSQVTIETGPSLEGSVDHPAPGSIGLLAGAATVTGTPNHPSSLTISTGSSRNRIACGIKAWSLDLQHTQLEISTGPMTMTDGIWDILDLTPSFNLPSSAGLYVRHHANMADCDVVIRTEQGRNAASVGICSDSLPCKNTELDVQAGDVTIEGTFDLPFSFPQSSFGIKTGNLTLEHVTGTVSAGDLTVGEEVLDTPLAGSYGICAEDALLSNSQIKAFGGQVPGDDCAPYESIGVKLEGDLTLEGGAGQRPLRYTDESIPMIADSNVTQLLARGQLCGVFGNRLSIRNDTLLAAAGEIDGLSVTGLELNSDLPYEWAVRSTPSLDWLHADYTDVPLTSDAIWEQASVYVRPAANYVPVPREEPQQDPSQQDLHSLLPLLSLLGGVSPFPDVQPGDWFYEPVCELAGRSILHGYPDGYFRPRNNVTWGEALKLVLLAAHYEDQAPTGAHWASGFQSAAIQTGVLSSPVNLDAPIDRLSMAHLAAKALGLAPSRDLTAFADCQDGYVEALYEHYILQGSFVDGVRVYLPDSHLTRAEFAAILSRMD